MGIATIYSIKGLEDCNYIQYKGMGTTIYSIKAWRTATIYSIKSMEDCKYVQYKEHEDYNYIQYKEHGGLQLYTV